MATMFQAVAKMFHGITIQFKSQDLAISREALDGVDVSVVVVVAVYPPPLDSRYIRNYIT